MTATTSCYNRRSSNACSDFIDVSATEMARKVATERSPVVVLERPQSIAHLTATFPDSLVEWVHTIIVICDKPREVSDLSVISPCAVCNANSGQQTCAAHVCKQQLK